jgi:hypothetical protein
VDQNMPGLARELASAGWSAVEGLTAETPGLGLYRSLYRAVQGVLKARVEAYRYCGVTRACEQGRPVLGEAEWRETFPPEPDRIHRYVMTPEAVPEQVLTELLRALLLTVAQRLPERRVKGLARLLRRRILTILHGKVYLQEWCGDAPMCGSNEPIDPWNRSDSANEIRRAV